MLTRRLAATADEKGKSELAGEYRAMSAHAAEQGRVLKATLAGRVEEA